MHHIAIMKKSWGLIPKIISGEKTVESRWYQTRRAPWHTIIPGDTVWFKDSGEKVTAKAIVSDVKEYVFDTVDDIVPVLEEHGKDICLENVNPHTWVSNPRYGILIFLKDVEEVQEPFGISKKGFGISSAWMVVSDISHVRI